MPDLGTPRPALALPDATGVVVDLDAAAPGAPVLVLFLCNHCPYVKHVGPRLGELAERWTAAGVTVVGVNPNARTHPGDAPDRMPAFAERHGWAFPYLVDADQAVARSFGAASTPEPFLFDRDGRLAYRGQFDATRPGPVPATGADLDAAVAAVLAAGTPAASGPAAGCAIKWA